MKNLKNPVRYFAQAQVVGGLRINSLHQQYNTLPQNTLDKYYSLIDKNQFYENIIPRSYQQSSYHFSALENSPYYTQQSTQFIDQNILDPIWLQIDNNQDLVWRPFLSIMLAECFGRQFQPNNQQTISQNNINDNRDIFWLIGATELLNYGTQKIQNTGLDPIDKQTLNHNDYNISLNTGNYLYFQPWLVLDQYIKEGIINSDKSYKLYQAYFNEVSLGQLGQYQDQSYSKSKDYIPTIEEFMQMTINKCFIRKLYSRSLSILLDLNEYESQILFEFGINVGILSQLHNDMINLLSEDQKGMVGQDIYSGKKSFMVIYAYHNTSEQNQERLLEILNKEDNIQDEINEAISIIRQSGAFEYTQEVINEKLENMFKDLRCIAKNQSPLDNIQTLITQTFLNY